MLSTKTLFLALLFVVAVQSSTFYEHRHLMEEGDHGDEDCHCMGDGTIHCEDPAHEEMCECTSGEPNCDHGDHDHDHDHASHDDEDSGAASNKMRLMGTAIAGAVVAAAL